MKKYNIKNSTHADIFIYNKKQYADLIKNKKIKLINMDTDVEPIKEYYTNDNDKSDSTDVHDSTISNDSKINNNAQ